MKRHPSAKGVESRPEWRPGASHPFYKVWQQANAQGWRVEIAKSNHLRWISPDGGVVTSSITPSDTRAVHRHTSIMRRYGYLRGVA
jgi:hypothetical protein